MTYHGRPPLGPGPGDDPRRGPRRYGPGSTPSRPDADRGAGGPGRYRDGDAPVGGHAWSEIDGPAWAGPDEPTEVQPRYPDRGYRSPPPRGPVPPIGGGRGPERQPGPGRPRHRTPGAVVVGRIVAAFLSLSLVLISGVVWAAFGGQPHNASNAPANAGDVGVVTQTTNAQGNVVPLPAGGMNILIVGSDARTDAAGNPLSPQELDAVHSGPSDGGVSTDTIMIVHVPGGGGKATAVSIPRDTWIPDSVVHAPGVVGPYSDGTQGAYRANKINSFYGSAKAYETQYLVSQGVTDKAEIEQRSSEAGRTMLIKVIQQFTGWKINHFAEVNLIGFYLLSQAIGGVPVCLLHPVDDHFSGADFPAGHFEVSGSQALAFVRQRHGLPGGDLDRIRRQQAFLAGAADKILSAGTLTSPGKLSALVDAANRSLVLDSGFNLLTFAQQMIGLTSGNINFVPMPTRGAQPGVGTDALATDPAQIRTFFAAIASASAAATTSRTTTAAPSSVPPSSVTVDVQNATEVSGMAAAVGAQVAGAGFVRGQLSDYPGTTPSHQQTTTTVRYPSGGLAAARQVLAVIKVGTLVADDAVPAGHVLVVVGTDLPKPTVSGGAGGTGPARPSPTTTSPSALPTNAINAADPGCVN